MPAPGAMHAAATDVKEGIVPNSGHWVMEENPKATIALVTDFLASGPSKVGS